MEMHVCVRLCLCTPPLETRPFPCHPNRLLQQEALGNYRDAACSNGVPPQPIIGRDSPCQGATLGGGGVVLRRKERIRSIGSLSLSISHPPIHKFLTELQKGGGGGALLQQAGPGFVPRADIRLIHAGDKWQEDTSDFAITQADVGNSKDSAVNRANRFAECSQALPNQVGPFDSVYSC